MSTMEVHFNPGVKAKLDQLVRDSGRGRDEILEDAVLGLFDEFASTRATLDRRYDDLDNGRTELIDGEDVFARLRARAAARRAEQ
jgi:hypothetical protein